MQSFPQLGKNTFRKASGFRHRGKRVRLLLCVAKGLFEIAASPSVAAYKVLFYECVGGEARGKRLPSGDYAVKNNSAVILYFEIDGPFAETQSRRQVTFNGSLASYVQWDVRGTVQIRLSEIPLLGKWEAIIPTNETDLRSKAIQHLLQAMVVECRRLKEYFLQWISIALFLVMRDPPAVPFLAKAATRSLCYHLAEELGKDDIDDVLVHTRACIGTWLSRDGALAIFSSLPTSLLLSRHTSIPQRTSSTYSQQQNTDTVVVESSQFPDRNCWWVYYTTLLSYYICGGVVA